MRWQVKNKNDRINTKKTMFKHITITLLEIQVREKVTKIDERICTLHAIHVKVFEISFPFSHEEVEFVEISYMCINF
jgi:hypothetical protein